MLTDAERRKAYNASQRQNWADAGALIDSAAIKAADRAAHGWTAPAPAPRPSDGWVHISLITECDFGHGPFCNCPLFRHGVPVTPEDYVCGR